MKPLIVIMLILPSFAIAKETRFRKALDSCAISFLKTAGPGPYLPEHTDAAAKACQDALVVELAEKEETMSAIQKNPQKTGCRIGAYYLLKGNNKDATEKMIRELADSKCK